MIVPVELAVGVVLNVVPEMAIGLPGLQQLLEAGDRAGDVGVTVPVAGELDAGEGKPSEGFEVRVVLVCRRGLGADPPEDVAGDGPRSAPVGEGRLSAMVSSPQWGVGCLVLCAKWKGLLDSQMGRSLFSGNMFRGQKYSISL